MSIDLDEKRKAILDAEGHILVLGGPGSGKTTIALLKAKAQYPLLLPGQKLLFLSFSRAAVRQILNGCQEHLSTEVRSVIEVKTYHAFCMEVLRSHGRLLSGKVVSIIFPTKERLLKSKFNGNWSKERERLAKEDARFCFDLFASGVAELLEKSRVLRELMASCYPTVIVDEFQDTDDCQWRIVKMLTTATRILCLADKDQGIFDYREDIDPNRIECLKAEITPKTIDLGGENHRSPRGGILGYANAVLNNTKPLPNAKDVSTVIYHPNTFNSTVHAAVLWTFSTLRKNGVKNPSVAVLARSNSLVAKISGILSGEHQYKQKLLLPHDHSVVWDAELTAAAGTVVASIMEWSDDSLKSAVSSTLEHIAQYYELKNATYPSQSAVENFRKFREAAGKVCDGATPRIKAAKELLTVFNDTIDFVGNPVNDWKVARKVLNDVSALNELFREARMVRLFRATDAVGSGLADLWLAAGNYRGARTLIAQTLERERIIAVDQEPHGCVLMSMHKSKGKEFDGVVIVEGTYSGLFFDSRHEQPPFERARRLLRVAITRAKTRVLIVRSHNAIPLVH